MLDFAIMIFRQLSIFLIVVMTSQAAFSQVQCRDVFPERFQTILANPKDKSRGSDYFRIEDQNSAFYFKAELYEGRVKIKASLVDPIDKTRSSMRGPELFAQMIEYFGIENIRILEGRWFEFSDANFGSFNRALQEQGLSPQDAAFRTWTGQRALDYGFYYVSVGRGVVQTPHGQIGYVKADFSKEPISEEEVPVKRTAPRLFLNPNY